MKQIPLVIGYTNIQHNAETFSAACKSLLVFNHNDQSMSKLLLVFHNLKTGQDIIHEFCESDFAFELVEGSPEPDENGDLDVESKLFYRLD